MFCISRYTAMVGSAYANSKLYQSLYIILYIYTSAETYDISHGFSWTHAETLGSLGRALIDPPFSVVSGPLSIWHGGLPTALSQDANGASGSWSTSVMAP